jgi:hypothetical protein
VTITASKSAIYVKYYEERTILPTGDDAVRVHIALKEINSEQI